MTRAELHGERDDGQLPGQSRRGDGRRKWDRAGAGGDVRWRGHADVLADVEPEPLARAERALRDHGATVLAVQADVSQAGDVEALAAKTLEAFGAVHIVCNNAG